MDMTRVVGSVSKELRENDFENDFCWVVIGDGCWKAAWAGIGWTMACC